MKEEWEGDKGFSNNDNLESPSHNSHILLNTINH